MEKNCEHCQHELTENDFFCDKLIKCKHNMETKCRCKYICPKKGCKFESQWKLVETECLICDKEEKSQAKAKEDFRQGLFQKIIKVDETMCFETYPCQHYVTFIDNYGSELVVLITLSEIKRICISRNIDFNQLDPHKFYDKDS